MPSPLTSLDAAQRSRHIPPHFAALAGVAALVLGACTASGYGASPGQTPNRAPAPNASWVRARRSRRWRGLSW